MQSVKIFETKIQSDFSDGLIEGWETYSLSKNIHVWKLETKLRFKYWQWIDRINEKYFYYIIMENVLLISKCIVNLNDYIK